MLYIDNDTKKIEVKGGRIIYTLKNNSTDYYFTYNETLLNIMCKEEVSPSVNGDYLRFKITHPFLRTYFHILAYACYEGLIHEETFIDDLNKFIDFKVKNNLEVDHFDAHNENNTKENLSLMDAAVNNKKKNITSKVEYSALLVGCYVDGKYRIHFQNNVKDNDILFEETQKKLDYLNLHITKDFSCKFKINYLCEDAESCVECLYYLVNNHITFNNNEIIPALRTERCWRKSKDDKLPNSEKITKELLKDVKVSVVLQGRVASAPINLFNEYK